MGPLVRLTNPFAAAIRQAAVLERTSARPWGLPEGRWLIAQTWEDVLFAHWRVPASALRALVPASLEIDTFDGSAWIGVLPFRLTGFRLRGLLAAPRLSSFPELNVRTYVVGGGRQGIFFISLDAARNWAVVGARRLYKLPYYRARMTMRKGEWIEFSSMRVRAAEAARTFQARYRPTGPPSQARPGTLEHFLTERYCLFTSDGSRILRADAHHLPWSIQQADAQIDVNTIAPIELPPEEPLLHYSARQDAVIWPLVAL